MRYKATNRPKARYKKLANPIVNLGYFAVTGPCTSTGVAAHLSTFSKIIYTFQLNPFLPGYEVVFTFHINNNTSYGVNNTIIGIFSVTIICDIICNCY